MGIISLTTEALESHVGQNFSVDGVVVIFILLGARYGGIESEPPHKNNFASDARITSS